MIKNIEIRTNTSAAVLYFAKRGVNTPTSSPPNHPHPNESFYGFMISYTQINYKIGPQWRDV
jgi:hypothetical protein